jgi:FkbM family methyltransferase
LPQATVDNSLIYDVGAHNGSDTAFYLKKGFHVIAIEAIPEFCSALKEKFSEYVASGHLNVLNLAVSGTTGHVDFYVYDNASAQGTANPDWVKRNITLGRGTARKISVSSAGLADIMKEHGIPRYCKIDIEGNDLEALATLEGLAEKPKFVSIESENKEWNKLLEEFDVFERLGYSKFKVIDQSFVPRQKCPASPSEGRFVTHTFDWWCSGLFGDELPGRWLDMYEALEAYKNIFRGYALYGDDGIFSGRLKFYDLVGKMHQLSMRMRGHKDYRLVQSPHAGWYDTHASR